MVQILICPSAQAEGRRQGQSIVFTFTGQMEIIENQGQTLVKFFEVYS